VAFPITTIMAVLVRILSADALKALQRKGYSDSSKAATICGQLLSICTLFMACFIEGRHMLCDREFTGKKTTRIIEGSLPFYLSRQLLKRTICLAVCADGNNQLGTELLAFSQRMNRDITSSASSPPSIDINSMWACWLISQSVRSCAFCKYLMIGWFASTNNIVQVATPGGSDLQSGCWTSNPTLHTHFRDSKFGFSICSDHANQRANGCSPRGI